MALKAQCRAGNDQLWRAPIRFIPTLKNMLPAEPKATSRATRIDVFATGVWEEFMNVRRFFAPSFGQRCTHISSARRERARIPAACSFNRSKHARDNASNYVRTRR